MINTGNVTHSGHCGLRQRLIHIDGHSHPLVMKLGAALRPTRMRTGLQENRAAPAPDWARANPSSR